MVLFSLRSIARQSRLGRGGKKPQRDRRNEKERLAKKRPQDTLRYQLKGGKGSGIFLSAITVPQIKLEFISSYLERILLRDYFTDTFCLVSVSRPKNKLPTTAMQMKSLFLPAFAQLSIHPRGVGGVVVRFGRDCRSF